MTRDNNCFSFLEIGLAAGDGRRAGPPAATTDRRVARVAVRRTVRDAAAGGPALLALHRPSHLLLSADEPHLPAPRPEVSKVNEKFHP